jgi:hypothetical protein
MGRACSTHGRGEHKILLGKPIGKRPLWGHRYRCKDNTNMDLKEIGCEDVGWIHVA